MWERHILNCGAVAALLDADDRVADVGSGAGLPGLALAIAVPTARITLIEPLLRRTTFLTEAVARLGLDNVDVVRSRAEQLHGVLSFSRVVARAVAPLDRLIGWCLPLVETGGELLAMKGSRAAEEIEASREMWGRREIKPPELVTVGAGLLAEPTTVVRVSWEGPATVGLPTADERHRGSRRRR